MSYSASSQFLARHRDLFLKAVTEFSRSFWREEDGQDLVEYSLLMACVALGSMGVLSGVKSSVLDLWQSANKNLSAAASAAS